MVCSSLGVDEVLPSPYSNQSRKKDDHLPCPKVPPPSPHRCLSNRILLQSYTRCRLNRWRGTWVQMGKHQPCCCTDQTDGSRFTLRDNWWSFQGLESPEGPWIWWVRPLGFLNTSWLAVPGASLLWKLKNAVPWHALTVTDLYEFTESLPAASVIKWMTAIEKWEKDDSEVNPFVPTMKSKYHMLLDLLWVLTYSS